LQPAGRVLSKIATVRYRSVSIGADTKHDVCLQGPGNESREFDCIAHRAAVIDQWAQSLGQRFGSPIAVAVELANGPIVYALQKYDFLVVVAINPSTPDDRCYPILVFAMNSANGLLQSIPVRGQKIARVKCGSLAPVGLFGQRTFADSSIAAGALILCQSALEICSPRSRRLTRFCCTLKPDGRQGAH
jgi:hypothetical protein